MAEPAHLEQVEPRSIAGVRRTAPRGAIGDAIYRALDEVWPVLREPQVQPGHNVVIYDGGDEATAAMIVGVEVFSDVTDQGEVCRAATGGLGPHRRPDHVAHLWHPGGTLTCRRRCRIAPAPDGAYWTPPPLQRPD